MPFLNTICVLFESRLASLYIDGNSIKGLKMCDCKIEFIKGASLGILFHGLILALLVYTAS